jgi:hypothetical protein
MWLIQKAKHTRKPLERPGQEVECHSVRRGDSQQSTILNVIEEFVLAYRDLEMLRSERGRARARARARVMSAFLWSELGSAGLVRMRTSGGV